MRRKRAWQQTLVLLSGLLVGPFTLAEKLSLFPAGEHCVAYKARKKLVMLKSIDVVGKNCDISVQILPDLGGLFYLESYVPVSGFSSGESERDKDVLKILKANDHPDLIFRSKKFDKDHWKKLFAKESFELEGELSVGGQFFPVKASVFFKKVGDDYEVDGLIKARFSDFGISPPALAAGLAVKVQEELELHFHFLGQRVLGSDNLLPEQSFGMISEKD